MMTVKLQHVYVTFISIWITPVDIRVVLEYNCPFLFPVLTGQKLFKTQSRM